MHQCIIHQPMLQKLSEQHMMLIWVLLERRMWRNIQLLYGYDLFQPNSPCYTPLGQSCHKHTETKWVCMQAYVTVRGKKNRVQWIGGTVDFNKCQGFEQIISSPATLHPIYEYELWTLCFNTHHHEKYLLFSQNSWILTLLNILRHFEPVLWTCRLPPVNPLNPDL